MSNNPHDILEIPIKSLVVDEVIALSGRTEKERETNAKELVPFLANGWDSAQPGQVFQREGKYHVAAGFTRIYALKELLKEKDAVGYFVEVPDDRAKLRTAAIRTNAGKDISSLAKGKIFLAMEAGDDPATLPVGAVALAGMTAKQIAEDVGTSEANVWYCLTLATSPQEAQDMLEAGEVNANAVARAKQLAQTKGDDGEKTLDEAKMIKALRAAIKHAKSEGKECASKKDLDAIKDEIFPLKAVTTPKKAAATPPADNSGDDAPPTDQEKDDEDKDDPKESDKPTVSGDTPSLNLGAPAPAAPKKPSGKELKIIRQLTIDSLTVLIRKAEKEYTGDVPLDLEDDEVEHIATMLADSGVRINESPI